MEKKAIAVFLADGFEEIEALTPVDVLRRAGMDVRLAAVTGNGLVVNGAHGIPVTCDCRAAEVVAEELAMTVFPGGLPGATNLAADKTTLDIVRNVYAQGGFTTAICAAPIALKAAGVLTSQAYTCYPGFEKQIGGKYTAAVVERDGQLITGRGPGAAADFAFELLKALGKADAAKQLRAGMLFA